ncbi:MAG: type II toxin-antitoxin system HicA family toxin [Candidatus Kariarchaeaceae archaeon]|jgi:predicted RNA binding protein YcfA (HicA-like mRNA interferase family)
MVKYNELFRLLKNDGWVIVRHPVKSEQLTIPYHPGKEVKIGLLKAILKQANIKQKKR